MVWSAALAVCICAAFVWAALVPRISIADPDAPDFDALVTPSSIAAVAIATLAVAQILWLVPAEQWWLWLPYLAVGAPLVATDLRTTWLPLRLQRVALGTMLLGGLGLSATAWPLAAAAAVGGLAARGLFWLAWRLLPGLGFGDVRLMGLVGAVAALGGPTAWLTALLLGTLMGAGHGIAHAWWARRGAGRPRHFPYGPALWLGPVVALLISAA